MFYQNKLFVYKDFWPDIVLDVCFFQLEISSSECRDGSQALTNLQLSRRFLRKDWRASLSCVLKGRSWQAWLLSVSSTRARSNYLNGSWFRCVCLTSPRQYKIQKAGGLLVSICISVILNQKCACKILYPTYFTGLWTWIFKYHFLRLDPYSQSLWIFSSALPSRATSFTSMNIFTKKCRILTFQSKIQ